MTNPDDPVHPKELKNFMGDFGLTKREWYAGLAMQALINCDWFLYIAAKENPKDNPSDAISRSACIVADHLIAALNTPQEGQK